MEKQTHLVHTYTDMQGKNLELNPNHTFHFVDSNSVRTQEHAWDCEVQVDGIWHFNKNTKELHLSAKYWRGAQDKKGIQKSIFDKSFTQKVLNTQNFDFISSDVKCYSATWKGNKYQGMTTKLLKNNTLQTKKQFQPKHQQVLHKEECQHCQKPEQHKVQSHHHQAHHKEGDTHQWHHQHGHHHDQHR